MWEMALATGTVAYRYASYNTDRKTALMTILPLSLEGTDYRSASSPSQRSPRLPNDDSDPAHVPLPPSVPGSERESVASDSEKKVLPTSRLINRHVDSNISHAASEHRGEKETGMFAQFPQDPSRQSSPDPSNIPLPASMASSGHGRLSLNQSRRTSLLSMKSQNESGPEGDIAEPSSLRPEIGQPSTGSVSQADLPLRPSVNLEPAASSFADTVLLVERALNTRARVVELQQELVQLLHESGGHGRCLGIQSFLYKRLVECFRLEMKSPFITLFEQMQECQAIYPSLESGRRLNGTLDSSMQLNSSQPGPSWIYTLPRHSQPGVMKLLNNLRTVPSYLAERISALNSSQLRNLARPHLPSGRVDSSIESSPSSRADLRLLRPRSRTAAPTIDGLTQDPLRLMMLSCFDPAAMHGSSERSRQLDVWSRTCARLIDDQRVGSNEFCFAVLEIASDVTPWELGTKLEQFLLELIHTGSFITNATDATEPVSSKAAGQLSTANTDSINAFFDRAVESLLDLVTGNPNFSVPTLALELIHSTLYKIHDPQKLARARRFFVFTWYCNTFLSSALLFPERHHILLNVHISSDIRQKILRELATRVQKTVRDVLDPRASSPILPTAANEKVVRLVSIFDETAREQPNTSTEVDGFERPFIVLFAEDVLAITRALYPNDPSEPLEKAGHSEQASSPSSVTGSSTLTAGTNDLRSGINSAFTPSISGTSVTSHTLSSDFFLRSPEKVTDKTGSTTKSRPGTSGSLDSKVDEIPVQSFLPELWKLCASRKSSDSPQVTVESAIFFVECPGGRLNCQISRTLDGDLGMQIPSGDPTTDTLTSVETQVIMRALSKSLAEGRFHRHPSVKTAENALTALEALFRLHLDQAQCQHDFQSSFFWFHALKSLRNIPSPSNTSLMTDLAQRYAALVQKYVSGSERYQEWIHALQAACTTQANQLAQLGTQVAALRTKMWYVTDVRHSDVYEHAINVVKALGTMAKPPARKPHGVAAWAYRLRASFGHEKAQSQAFDLISAPKICGGPNKLADEQADLTSRWLTSESIENFCGGEERMHRFCFEIQRCATKLVGATMSESPVLWSSSLFSAASEKGRRGASSAKVQLDKVIPASAMASKPAAPVAPRLNSSNRSTRGNGLGFSIEHTGLLKAPQFGQGTLSDPFTNPGADTRVPLRATLPPSPVSLSTSPIGARNDQAPSSSFVEHLRRDVVALLLSDLGRHLWLTGSETDIWINSDAIPLSTAADHMQDTDQEPIIRVLHSTGATLDASNDPLLFDFREGYAKLLSIFRYSLDPHQKLQALYELSILAECQSLSMDEPSTDPSTSEETDLPPGISKLVAQARGVPRIRLTRLQEVVANCNERRHASRRSSAPLSSGLHTLLPGMSSSSARDISNALAIVSTLFLDGNYRPSTLFRDLQLIASFVPTATLDSTPHGTVFWTVGLVAMGLKSETCRLMTRRATAIVDYHVNSHAHNHREPTRAGVQVPSQESEKEAALSPEELAATTLADAARFYLLSALEGEPAAARELALFYLTHPEVVRPAMLPLSRPGDVLRSINLLGGGVERKFGDSDTSGSGVLDPPTFAIAYHWMEFAANAGDPDAQTFLSENSDLGSVF